MSASQNDIVGERRCREGQVNNQVVGAPSPRKAREVWRFLVYKEGQLKEDDL